MISLIKFGNFIFNASNGISVNSIEEKNAPDRAIALAQPARGRGVTVLSLTEKAKVITVRGTISSDGDATYQSDIRDFVTALMAEGDLQMTTTDGIYLYEDCILMNPTSIIPQDEHYNIDYVPFSIQFLAPKGIAVSATLTEAAFSDISTSPYSNSVSLLGTLAPEPIITMTLDSTGGVAITNITFLNQDTNESISLATQYQSNDVVQIDTKEKTVKYNTRDKRFSGLIPLFNLDTNQFKIDVEGSNNVAISQETSNSERSVYGATYLSQQINPDAAISMPQIDLLVKKFTPASTTAKVLVVGGGGGGGGGGVSGAENAGAGGGAGGYKYEAAYTLAVASYPVTVGTGGARGTTPSSSGSNGSNSVFDTLTSIGGGGGGKYNDVGLGGGSGGGGGGDGGAGGAGTAGQGYAGGSGNSGQGSGGGGGGSAGAGNSNYGGMPNGGAGTSNSISGAAVTYAEGGEGSDRTVVRAEKSTIGSGGRGSQGNGDNSTAGNTGRVIIRYTTGVLVATGGTITTDGADTIHTFTSSGTFEVTSAGASITDMQVRVETDNAGVPSGTIVTGGSATVSAASVSSSSYSVVPVTFSSVSLADGTDYHIVIRQSGGDVSNYYSVKLNTAGGYSQGNVETSTNSGSTWSEQSGEDLWMRLYTAFPTGFNLDVTIGYYVSHYSVA